MKRKIRIGELKRLVREALLREDEATQVEQEDGNDSLDSQVDRYLAQYEGEAKNSQKEGRDFRMLTRRILEAEGDEDEGGGDEGGDAGDEAAKPGLENIDVESFANSVVRLIDNYDNLLEVRSTLMRRAINFVAKAYSPEVVDALKKTLRDDHGLVPGESQQDVEDEEYPAPVADRAGSGGEGGAPA